MKARRVRGSEGGPSVMRRVGDANQLMRAVDDLDAYAWRDRHRMRVDIPLRPHAHRAGGTGARRGDHPPLMCRPDIRIRDVEEHVCDEDANKPVLGTERLVWTQDPEDEDEDDRNA